LLCQISDDADDPPETEVEMSGQSDDGHDGRGSSVAALAPAMHPSTLVEQIGGRYADALGIALRGGRSAEIHKWLVAAILFGARISGKIAARTYREFERAGVLSPHRMLDAGWDALVDMLDRGGYARYDFKTATKLLNVHRGLMQQYGGDLNKLHDSARDARDLEQRVRNPGKGIGDATVNIFCASCAAYGQKRSRRRPYVWLQRRGRSASFPCARAIRPASCRR
jgi:hypothetical protein